MVGIGGVGMSSIAEVLLDRGFEVTGSDLNKSEITEHLAGLGATIWDGHHADHVEDADVVVYSSAVNVDENPETREAALRRMPLIKRSVMLGELMRMKYGIAIAGTHGKTTTTSMTGIVVTEGGFDPTIIVGGKVAVFGSNAISGSGDIIVIEADEYDRTFLRLTPTIAVITNIDEDHLDIYDDLEDIKDAFIQFANSVPFYGASIVCLDDANVREIVPHIDRRLVTYGESRQAQFRVLDIKSDGLVTTFTVAHEGTELGDITIQTVGRHNVLNALAAVAVGSELEISFDQIREGLHSFTGVYRRFEVLHNDESVAVVNDYAHHPAEVEATLQAASSAWPDRRVVAIFQPHLYSRTKRLQWEFAQSFLNADAVIVTEIYGARERPDPTISGSHLVDEARASGHLNAHFVSELRDLSAFVKDFAEKGDCLVFLGAGDIWRVCHDVGHSAPTWFEK